uniref:Uncharacterized protein n=1 Tax=Oncorhynchus kisutch TaxID=8019 RepID=A0A8C7GDE2_ONCKI
MEEPLHLICSHLDERIYVKMRNDRELRGRFAYNQNTYIYFLEGMRNSIHLFHCRDSATKRNIPMLFVRGDGVVLVAPPLRVG